MILLFFFEFFWELFENAFDFLGNSLVLFLIILLNVFSIVVFVEDKYRIYYFGNCKRRMSWWGKGWVRKFDTLGFIGKYFENR